MTAYVQVPGLAVAIRIDDGQPAQIAEGIRRLRREEGGRAEKVFSDGGRVVFVDFSRVATFTVTTEPPGGGVQTIFGFASSFPG